MKIRKRLEEIYNQPGPTGFSLGFDWTADATDRLWESASEYVAPSEAILLGGKI
jgi:hypothetical protein